MRGGWDSALPQGRGYRQQMRFSCTNRVSVSGNAASSHNRTLIYQPGFFRVPRTPIRSTPFQSDAPSAKFHGACFNPRRNGTVVAGKGWFYSDIDPRGPTEMEVDVPGIWMLLSCEWLHPAPTDIYLWRVTCRLRHLQSVFLLFPWCILLQA